jgi:hypothetical protein
VKLLEDIVNALIDDGGSLNQALLRTKVLLHRLGQPELVEWVSSELTGYGPDDALPEYRRATGRIVGNVSNGFHTHKNHTLPVLHLSEQHLEYLQGNGLRMGLDVLEHLALGAADNNALVVPLPPEFNAKLGEPLSEGFFVATAWRQIELSQVRQTLTVVRSRLLDFILKLQDKIGADMSEEEAKTAVARIDVGQMFAGAVIGDNATFVIGSHNHSKISNTSVKGDRDALAAELRAKGVSDADISLLNAALDIDPAPTEIGQYGPAVRGWMKNMFEKAVEASWNIELGIVGGLLTSALQRYYGL